MDGLELLKVAVMKTRITCLIGDDSRMISGPKLLDDCQVVSVPSSHGWMVQPMNGLGASRGWSEASFETPCRLRVHKAHAFLRGLG